MRVVIAPDSFKESLSAPDAAAAIATGLRRVGVALDIETLPMADGGEGTVEAVVSATGGRTIHADASDPLGRRIEAVFGMTGDGEAGVVEMAAASGLALLEPEERRPLETTTFGTGELIRAALDQDVSELVIGIGGSATVDGGVGMAQALGVHFLDERGRQVGLGGGQLKRIRRIDVGERDARIGPLSVRVACDVTNPLIGPEGAARVFAPQKGASAEEVEQLEAGLEHLADVIERDLGVDVRELPGGGAAGGLGAGLHAFLGARLEPGIEIVVDTVGLAARMQGAELVITGEGRLDGQSLYGKTPIGVARIAKRAGVPVIALAGSLGPGWQGVHEHGIAACFSILREPTDLAEAKAGAAELLSDAAEQVLRLWLSANRRK